MWKDLTLQQKAEIMKMSVANGVTDINDIQELYDDSIPNQFDDGGFVNFYNSLPRNQRDSTNYNVRRYWELNGKPKDFNEAVQRGMYTKQPDGWHANSVAYNETKDEYEFMKSPTHPTTIYEIGAYMGNKDFQKNYYLDYTSRPNYKYKRKPSWMYNNGGHLYKDAGSLDKGKQQPKYQYGIIEQILRENGVNFRVTSGFRHPNEAGNAGKSSAHTYALASGSPAAIDIVPGIGSNWNTLYKQMNSPEVRTALASYGLDILDETNPATMAKTKATGKHFHVGRGIKNQPGKGTFIGSTNPTIAAFNRVYGNQNMSVPDIDYEALYEPSRVYGLDWSNRPQQEEEQVIQRPIEPIMSVMEREEPQQEQPAAEQDNFVQLPSFRLSSLQSQPIAAQQRHELITPVMQAAGQEAPSEIQSILSSPYIIFGRDLG